MTWPKLFFILLIITIFNWGAFLNPVFSYSSADVPVHHWSYEAVDKLAIAGLLSVSGLDTRPMTRVQMAYKIKEAVDNIEEENIPTYLCLDREQIEYLQGMLYKLVDEFRSELVLIGVTTADKETRDDRAAKDKFYKFNLASPMRVEQRLASVKLRKDVLLENENGLRVEEGFNLRVRAYPWVNVYSPLGRDLPGEPGFAFSAAPTLKVAGNGTELFFDEVAAKFSMFNMELSVAKSAMWWGPGFNGAMLLSNNAKPLSIIKIRTINNFRFPWVFENLGLFGGSFFISKLEKDRNVPSPNFAGLRLEWAPLPYFTVSANRTSIMGGEGRKKFRLKDYWNTFVTKNELSHSIEGNALDTDQLASFDGKFVMPFRPEVRAASGMELYGEWAGEDKFAFWENELPGYLVGIFLTDILRDKGTDLRVEYARDKAGWYEHGIFNAGATATAYTYKGEIMGHHMGGDADDIFLRISKEAPFLCTPYFDAVKAGCQLDFERHGITLAAPEKLAEVTADIKWSHSDTVALLLKYEFEYYRNAGNISGRTARNHIVLLEGDFKF